MPHEESVNRLRRLSGVQQILKISEPSNGVPDRVIVEQVE